MPCNANTVVQWIVSVIKTNTHIAEFNGYMSSEEGADACPLHEGSFQALLHLQNTCNTSYRPQLPNSRCTCALHRILIKVHIQHMNNNTGAITISTQFSSAIHYSAWCSCSHTHLFANQILVIVFELVSGWRREDSGSQNSLPTNPPFTTFPFPFLMPSQCK